MAKEKNERRTFQSPVERFLRAAPSTISSYGSHCMTISSAVKGVLDKNAAYNEGCDFRVRGPGQYRFAVAERLDRRSADTA